MRVDFGLCMCVREIESIASDECFHGCSTSIEKRLNWLGFRVRGAALDPRVKIMRKKEKNLLAGQ